MTQSEPENLASQKGEDKTLKANEKKSKQSEANEPEASSEREATREREETETELAEQDSDDKSDRVATMKRENDVSTMNTAEELECVPIRHPRLPNTPPRFFVDKNGVVWSNARDKLKQWKPTKGSKCSRYTLKVSKTRAYTFRLEEIMACTFSDHFDCDKHYIFHKDGRQGNCAWDNLIICEDLATLQQKEIDRLEKVYPGTKYTVVRNIHDTLTFERYLVSDTGQVYSLISWDHVRPYNPSYGDLRLSLYMDHQPDGATRRFLTFRVPQVVIQSFRGRQPEHLQITHINGDKGDNTLKNLSYTEPTEETRITVQPVTDKTRWKIIGVLPWNGLSFSQHEVSDMGQVRKKDSYELLTVSRTSNGHASVWIRPDNQDLKTQRKGLFVSRLVANAFVDGYSETQNIVKHLNGDRLDNRAQNLKWVPNTKEYTHTTACRVVASLESDPKTQKEFRTMTEAQRELSISRLSYWVRKYGNPFLKRVNWDGKVQMTSIEVFQYKHEEKK